MIISNFPLTVYNLESNSNYSLKPLSYKSTMISITKFNFSVLCAEFVIVDIIFLTKILLYELQELYIFLSYCTVIPNFSPFDFLLAYKFLMSWYFFLQLSCCLMKSQAHRTSHILLGYSV